MESGSAGSHSECYTAPHFAGLSSPAIAERLRRLEKSGVVRSFTVDVDPQALGYTLKAIVRIKPFPEKMHILEKLLQSTPRSANATRRRRIRPS